MMNKYFPIKTDTACQLKWTWSTIWLYGGWTASCHRIRPEYVSIENFHNFHNTEKKLSDRQLMLDGKWPTGGCEYCQHAEEAGGSSDRQLHLTQTDISPIELETNPTAITVTPRILEVYLNNTCNFSCVYCGGYHSSVINTENEKHIKFLDNKDYYDTFENLRVFPGTEENYFKPFIEYLKHNGQGLKNLNVLGGEPFYQKEFDQLLDFFNEHPFPNLELSINTNLGIKKEKLIQYCEQIRQLIAKKKIKRFDLTASIDCWGPEQEYVRTGLDLEQWEENFNYLLEQRWIVLKINQTISVLTIKTMPTLLEKLAEWRKKRKVGHFFSAVTPHPYYLMPTILGGDVFKQDFETILSLMPDVTDDDKNAIMYMKGIATQIEKSKPNLEQINNLKIFLDELDRRRNTNWRKLFPWIQ